MAENVAALNVAIAALAASNKAGTAKRKMVKMGCDARGQLVAVIDEVADTAVAKH
jgi:hypothetical protein